MQFNFNCGCRFRKTLKAVVVKEVSKKEGGVMYFEEQKAIYSWLNNKSMGMRLNQETLKSPDFLKPCVDYFGP